MGRQRPCNLISREGFSSISKNGIKLIVFARNIHEAPAATADTPLHRAVSPLSQSTYRREYASWLHDSERPFRWRLRGFATNLPE